MGVMSKSNLAWNMFTCSHSVFIAVFVFFYIDNKVDDPTDVQLVGSYLLLLHMAGKAELEPDVSQGGGGG